MKNPATFDAIGLGAMPLGIRGCIGSSAAQRILVILGALVPTDFHPALRTVAQRRFLIGILAISLACFVLPVIGQTGVEDDIPKPESLHNLSPLNRPLRLALWSLAAAIVIVIAVWTALRNRVGPSLYKVSSDAHWDVDAQADAGELMDSSEVIEACAAFEQPQQSTNASVSAAKTDPAPEARLFVPASGATWGEAMLKAFLNTCLKVNCLGRTWRESAARQVQSSNLPDPREAELFRQLMRRWQEFHVDPENGIFLDHTSATGKRRVCVIRVTKDKHTIVEASFNAGFVLESVGRYLRSTDLVCRQSPGEYHAPDKNELAAMTFGEKVSLIRITEIPDPWQAMIGSAALRII